MVEIKKTNDGNTEQRYGKKYLALPLCFLCCIVGIWLSRSSLQSNPAIVASTTTNEAFNEEQALELGKMKNLWEEATEKVRQLEEQVRYLESQKSSSQTKLLSCRTRLQLANATANGTIQPQGILRCHLVQMKPRNPEK